MDIITHALCGISVGTVIATYTCDTVRQKTTAICLATFGAVLPDIDVISQWGRFDTTFGRWFSLSASGRDIYSSTYWYSHHGFMHSLFAAILFSLLLRLITRWRKIKGGKWLAIAFGSGYMIHLAGDMITPGGPWQGIRLLFPLNTYVGGTGWIWWWNNYDIFLCMLFSAIIGTIFSLWFSKLARKIVLPLFLGSLAAITGLTATRNHDFNRNEYTINEQYSKEIQKNTLPPSFYRAMATFDQYAKVPF